MDREKLLKIVNDNCYNVSALSRKLKIKQQYLSRALLGVRPGKASDKILKQLEKLIVKK